MAAQLMARFLLLPLISFSYPAAASSMIPPSTLTTLYKQCSPQVAPETLATVVAVESSGNPWANAVVGSSVKQPRSEAEAIATAKSIQANGANFSVGLMQVNIKNFKRYGLALDTAFNPCKNIAAGVKILTGCFKAASTSPLFTSDQHALRGAMSCYYSGNFQRGYRYEPGGSYVSKVERVVENVSVPAIKKLRDVE